MIPVDFILRANSSQFTRAVAGAETRLRGLKKSLASFGGGNIGALIGIAGLVRGFQSALTSAQDLRREAEKLNQPISDSVRSVAELADGFDSLKKGATEAAIGIISVFSRAGEFFGAVYSKIFQGVSFEQQKLNAKIEKETEESLKRIAKARDANSPEKLAEAEKRLAAIKRENELRAADSETKLKMLTDERLRIQQQLAAMAPNTVAAIEKQQELERNLRDIEDARKEIAQETADAKERQAKAVKQLEDRRDELVSQRDDIKKEEAIARADRILPSIEDLAARAEANEKARANYGIGATGSLVDALDPNDPALKAKRALELEQQARDAALSGDAVQRLQMAPQFQAEAEELRRSLAGSVQSKDSNIGDQFKDALEETNAELAEIKEALKGLIKSQ